MSALDDARAALARGNNNYGRIEIDAEDLAALITKHERLTAPPAGEDREALVRVISEAESATDDEGSWALPEDVADVILAAGSRRREPGPVTDAQVEAAAEAAHYAQGFDDWGVANESEREWSVGIARAALGAARSVTANQTDGGAT